MLHEKNIVLGVSGSIAAYKAVYLTRLLLEARAYVYPMLTPSACRFVGPLTFSALTGRRAVTDMWRQAEAGEIGHVEWAHLADILVLAPATADLISRLAAGRADDPICAVALATQAPRIIAPAMESGMWNNPVTQRNVDILRQHGAILVGPDAGALASGREGVGRMVEPEVIFETVLAESTPQDLVGRTVLVTAGPTREGLDPVRFISNASSGKMGYAIAREARRRGARVVLVSGPTRLAPPAGVEIVRVATTQQMLDACRRSLDAADVLVMAAAPADYRPTQPASVKVSKPAAGETFRVELESTTDILTTLKPRQGGRVVVGFAAETGAPSAKAKAKLQAKDLDLIVANDVFRPDAGFEVDTNVVEIIDRSGSSEKLPMLSKDAVARELLTRVVELLPER